jgi:uncharacterized protein
MTNKQKLELLNNKLIKLYEKESKKLLFHGWHHINFVRNKALEFGKTIKADLFLVESSALVHDLNYIVKDFSDASEGIGPRQKLLKDCKYTAEEMNRIESIILESETKNRGHKISTEGKALSDGDSLFKAVPLAPILFSSKFITENNVDITILANKILKEQKPLLDKNIFFYTSVAKKKYTKWIKQQLILWEHVREALKDKDVQEMLAICKKLGVL